jgi:hypothetical protein
LSTRYANKISRSKIKALNALDYIPPEKFENHEEDLLDEEGVIQD